MSQKKPNPNKKKTTKKENWLVDTCIQICLSFLLVSFTLGMQLPSVVSCPVTVDGFHIDISLLISYNEEPFDIYRWLCLWGVYLSVLKCALNVIWCILHMLHRGTEFPNCNKVSTWVQYSNCSISVNAHFKVFPRVMAKYNKNIKERENK